MAYGFQSWDTNGNPNNYGIVPVSVAGYISLSEGQKSGSWSFNVPSGLRLGFFWVANQDKSGLSKRTITVSGNTINVGSAADDSFGVNIYPATQGFIVVQMLS
ncbi:hypothetical protein [Klebsiella phage P528]|uniref:Uncharacterized protein n=1 Tax=Klebsiella phage P528 TaxID=2777348 RepID=A0A7T3NA61_9CAUD|nr:hypothetical protein [Klebsiella phage P528]